MCGSGRTHLLQGDSGISTQDLPTCRKVVGGVPVGRTGGPAGGLLEGVHGTILALAQP